jgi:DNA-binding MarR family transcriptional regulator
MADYETSGMNANAVAYHVMIAADGVADALLRPFRTTRAGGDLAADIRAARPDLLVVAGTRVTPELAELLAQPQFAAMPVILLAGETDAEAGGLLLDRPLTVLDAGAEPTWLAEAIAAAAGRAGTGVADSGGRYDAEARLEALRRDAQRVAAALAELAGSRMAEPGQAVSAGRIRAHIKARRQRERFFDAALFADPVWDILLDLAAARLEERPVSISSLCIAASVPTTTALRTIKQMVDRSLLVRAHDPSDARRSFIRLSPPTAQAMEGCLEAVLNMPGQ